METISKIKLNLSSLDNNLELISKIFLIVMWILTLYIFLKSPQTIPTHFNALGQADNYGSKETVVILPILGTIIYFGLTQLNKYPQLLIKNFRNNTEKQYAFATRTMRFLKVAILLIFSLVTLFTYLTSIGITNGLGFWFFPFTVGLLLVPTVIAISKSFNKKNNVA